MAASSVLVTTDWVAQHGKDANVRVVEVDVDTTAYDQGHVPGAAGWNWTTDLCDTMVRDIAPKQKLEELLGKSGIDNKTTIILYGDNNNWFAAWAFWQLKMYGHQDVTHHGRRPQEVAGRRPRARDRQAERSRRRPTRRAARISPCGRSFRKCSRRRPRRRPRSWTCGARRSSPARFWRRRGCPRRASAAATFPARRAFRGGRTATRTARSRAPTS